MRKHLIIALILLTISAAFSEVYRQFTDKEGRTINAKIISVDSDKKKVTLERKNKKRATVPINIFSISDQETILAWESNSSSSNNNNSDSIKPLTKSEMKSIGKKYVNEMNSKDWSISRNTQIYELQQLHQLEHFNTIDKKIMSIDDIEENAFKIELEVHVTPRTKEYDEGAHEELHYGWAFVSMEGDVKYCSFTNPHPVEIACQVIAKVGWNYKFKEPIDIGAFVGTLESCDIPTFNLTSNSTREDLIDEVPKIADWVRENGHKHDTTEPAAYYPEKFIKDELKRVEHYF